MSVDPKSKIIKKPPFIIIRDPIYPEVESKSCNQQVLQKQTILEKKFYRARIPKYTRRRKNPAKIISTKFSLSYLSNKCTPAMNPPCFRIADLAYPAIHSFTNEICIDKNFFQPFFSMINFKRIVAYSYDRLKKVWTYKLEERHSVDPHFKGYYYLIVLQNYLSSNQKIYQEEALNKSLMTNINQWMICLSQKFMEKNLSNKYTDVVDDKEIDCYGSIDDSTYQFIRKRPFFCMIENYELDSYEEYLVGFKHNKIMMDLVGMKHVF